MKNMSLKEIAIACKGVYYGDDESYYKEVTGVVIDSRKVETGNLFVALPGEKVDGHRFIPQVMQNGALCALSEKRIENFPHPYILVDSCRQALKDLAEFYRKSLNVTVIGITGSVGKTSTKEMISSVLEQKYKVLKTAGNFNNEIGLPLTVFQIREEHQVAVLEMGISDFGEMERLARVARPDICVITNIGYAHLEQLRSRDGILKAKTEMFRFMNPEGQIFLNGDDDKLITIKKTGKVTPTFFGMNPELDLYASDIHSLGLKGSTCHIHTNQGDFNAQISIAGEHMVYNALAGTAVGLALGLNTAEIAAGIQALVPISGRNNLIEKNGFTIIDDCYNANPASMRASLDVLTYAKGRKVAILGDMFELGSDEAHDHYEVGQYAAKSNVDLLCCIGKLSENMYQGALDAGIHAKWFPDKAAFFNVYKELLETGDTILIKASHGMEFPEIIEKL